MGPPTWMPGGQQGGLPAPAHATGAPIPRWGHFRVPKLFFFGGGVDGLKKRVGGNDLNKGGTGTGPHVAGAAQGGGHKGGGGGGCGRGRGLRCARDKAGGEPRQLVTA